MRVTKSDTFEKLCLASAMPFNIGKLQLTQTLCVTVQGGGKKTSAMKSHVISTKTSLDLIFPG